ncbi:MAG: alpha/beta fold hydrolase, partial [Ktedonobacteraceae bacterium]|nr:alpha/beta fold hydrolase [Ktedonobacteraceae bacterium]
MDPVLTTREPENKSHATPLLFVHGAWHGAWYWDEHFLPYFAQHGYVAHALDLHGHGKSEGQEKLRWVSIANYVSDVAQTAAQFERPPVLIGHSMGGLIVQKYLETYQVPAGILLASVPPRGVLRTTLSIARRHPLAFLKTNLTLKLYHIVGTSRLAHEAFFSAEMPEQQVNEYYTRVQNESYRAFLDMLVFCLPRPQRVKTPMLVLGAEKDVIFIPREVEATARAYATQAQIFPG